MIDPSIYRAYDVRGRYPKEMNADAAGKIAEALAGDFFKKGFLVVAHDARKSSPDLYRAVIKGLKGRKVIKMGPATTPMFYYLIASRNASGGVMVTASHNPPEWNGLKIVGPEAAPISGFDVKKIVEDEE